MFSSTKRLLTCGWGRQTVPYSSLHACRRDLTLIGESGRYRWGRRGNVCVMAGHWFIRRVRLMDGGVRREGGGHGGQLCRWRHAHRDGSAHNAWPLSSSRFIIHRRVQHYSRVGRPGGWPSPDAARTAPTTDRPTPWFLLTTSGLGRLDGRNCICMLVVPA